MSSTYYQCKAARAATFAQKCTNIELGENIGSDKEVNFTPISSLDCIGDTEVLNTFRGTRMSSNNVSVNQNISFSYDPSTLTCMICETPHSILKTGAGDAPPILIFCDQNFIPTLSGGSSCIAISRLEDGTLSELVDLAAEVLERNPIPVGTILLLGSASHLHNVGTSIYAIDWCEAITKLSEKLRNVKTLPTPPHSARGQSGIVEQTAGRVTHLV